MSKSWTGDNFHFPFFQVVTAVNCIQGVIFKGHTNKLDWPSDVLCLHVIWGGQNHLKHEKYNCILGDQDNSKLGIDMETKIQVWKDPVGPEKQQ